MQTPKLGFLVKKCANELGGAGFNREFFSKFPVKRLQNFLALLDMTAWNRYCAGRNLSRGFALLREQVAILYQHE